MTDNRNRDQVLSDTLNYLLDRTISDGDVMANASAIEVIHTSLEMAIDEDGRLDGIQTMKALSAALVWIAYHNWTSVQEALLKANNEVLQ